MIAVLHVQKTGEKRVSFLRIAGSGTVAVCETVGAGKDAEQIYVDSPRTCIEMGQNNIVYCTRKIGCGEVIGKIKDFIFYVHRTGASSDVCAYDTQTQKTESVLSTTGKLLFSTHSKHLAVLGEDTKIYRVFKDKIESRKARDFAQRASCAALSSTRLIFSGADGLVVYSLLHEKIEAEMRNSFSNALHIFVHPQRENIVGIFTRDKFSLVDLTVCKTFFSVRFRRGVKDAKFCGKTDVVALWKDAAGVSVIECLRDEVTEIRFQDVVDSAPLHAVLVHDRKQIPHDTDIFTQMRELKTEMIKRIFLLEERIEEIESLFTRRCRDWQSR